MLFFGKCHFIALIVRFILNKMQQFSRRSSEEKKFTFFDL